VRIANASFGAAVVTALVMLAACSRGDNGREPNRNRPPPQPVSSSRVDGDARPAFSNPAHDAVYDSATEARDDARKAVAAAPWDRAVEQCGVAHISASTLARRAGASPALTAFVESVDAACLESRIGSFHQAMKEIGSAPKDAPLDKQPCFRAMNHLGRIEKDAPNHPDLPAMRAAFDSACPDEAAVRARSRPNP
jgi:hypothetical protein